MAQSVFANPQPRYHKTDDPLADLAAITGFRGEGAERSVDDFTLDLEQELLGAFSKNEAVAGAAERSLDDDLEAGFNAEFSALAGDDVASEFDAAFDDGFDAAGAEPANSNAQPAAAWEEFSLEDDDFALAGEDPAPVSQPVHVGYDAELAEVAAEPRADAFVDLDFDDFDPADFEAAAPAAEASAEPDFESELFAQIAEAPAAEPVAAAPPQSDPDFEAELNAVLGHIAPVPVAAPAPVAAPVAAPAAATPVSDPFAELAALAASYKAVRPSVFARAPSWTLRRDEPAAAVPAQSAPVQVAPALDAVEVASVEAVDEAYPQYDAPAIAADADFDTVEYVEETVPATDEIDVPDLEFDVDPEPAAYAEMAADYDPAPYAAPPVANAEPVDDELSGVEAQFSDFFDAEFERMNAEAPGAGRGQPVDMPAAAPVGQDYAPAAAGGSVFVANRTLLLAAGAAVIVLLGAVAGYSFLGGDAAPSQPTVIKADTDPVKVKPENPGGAEIANQDKAVYDKVAGEEASGAAEQKALVTTAEEPVDVNAAAAERAPAKSEDRVEASPQETAMGGATTAVQPKKVRTLVVKPDGTLVAAPAAAEAAPAADSAGVSYQPPGAGLAAEEAPAQAAELAAAAPEADPVKAAIAEEPVAEQPVAEQPDAAAEEAAVKKAAAEEKAKAKAEAKAKAKAEAKAKAKAEQVAAAEAAPAASGEWSIQIASQPSREGAQSSYKSLSGKFGSILGGRGVSIVQADIPGKGTFYRVRVPAGSKADANELCARYQAAGGSCFITR